MRRGWSKTWLATFAAMSVFRCLVFVHWKSSTPNCWNSAQNTRRNGGTTSLAPVGDADGRKVGASRYPTVIRWIRQKKFTQQSDVSHRHLETNQYSCSLWVPWTKHHSMKAHPNHIEILTTQEFLVASHKRLHGRKRGTADLKHHLPYPLAQKAQSDAFCSVLCRSWFHPHSLTDGRSAAESKGNVRCWCLSGDWIPAVSVA